MTYDVVTFSLTIRHFNNGEETGPSLLSRRLLGLTLGKGEKTSNTELKQRRFWATHVNRKLDVSSLTCFGAAKFEMPSVILSYRRFV